MRGYTALAGLHGMQRARPRRLRRWVHWAFENEDLAMSTKPVAEKEPATVVANDPDDLKGQSGPPMPTTHHHRGNSQ
jgi:hypothetical protein